MRILAITPIWPTRLQPVRAPYNLQQFKRVARTNELRVLDTVPYMPLASTLHLETRASVTAGLPATDLMDGVATWYVRQLYVPKVGVPVSIPLLLASLVPYHEHVRWADVLLGTWAYPHGCATVLLAKALRKPCVVKVHGSDLNVVANMGAARAFMKRLLPRVSAMVTVSRAQGDDLRALGVPDEKIALVPNGIDETRFYIRDKRESRQALGLEADGKLLVFVGRLEPAKGTGELLAAFERIRAKHPDTRLALVGEGVSRPEVDRFKDKPEIGGALIAPGERPFAEIPLWMGAADLVVLPSWMEGTPNVLLEALASGRACVASDVGGIPDVLADPRSGIVHRSKDVDSLADALDRALSRTYPPEDALACGPVTWDESARRLGQVLERAARARARFS
jgi:glycosyltransferase involved in cell wall biosynthesis